MIDFVDIVGLVNLVEIMDLVDIVDLIDLMDHMEGAGPAKQGNYVNHHFRIANTDVFMIKKTTFLTDGRQVVEEMKNKLKLGLMLSLAMKLFTHESSHEKLNF